MTNPDAPSTHDVSPTFKWSNKYDDQLRYIAETDELPDQEDTFDWYELRDAIKYKIKHLLDAFAETPSPILHPAASANGPDGGTLSASSSSSAQDGTAGLGVGVASSSSSSSTSSDPVPASATQAAEGLTDRFASSSATPTNGSSTSANGHAVDDEEDVNMSFDDAEEEDEDEEGGVANGNAAAAAANDTSTSFVSDADRSGYYAAKTQAPSDRKGNWGRVLTDTEKQQELGMVYTMLDDFDSSPPFTIQRLAELLLEPHTFVRSGPKFLSSLTRILSVTASHADFPPASPGPPPLVMNDTASSANGGAGGNLAGGVGMMRSVGPPSPSSEPLFSPIPFLQRPPPDATTTTEQGERTSSGEIPDLRLDGSADEGQQQQQQPTVATSTSAHPPAISTATAGSAAAAGGSSSGGSVGSSAISQPLGIPPGQVDELESGDDGSVAATAATDSADDSQPALTDAAKASGSDGTTSGSRKHPHQMDGAVHPLSSTTTTATQNATPAAAASGIKDDADDDDDEASSRLSKRLRSESPIRGSAGAGAGGAAVGIELAGKEAAELETKLDP